MLVEQASECEITLLHFAKIMFAVVMELLKVQKTKVLRAGAEGQWVNPSKCPATP